MNDVVWLSTRKESPARGYWDQQLLEDVFINKTHHESIGKLQEAIVVCPTEYQDVGKVNKEIAKLNKVIFIATSDECNNFDLSKLTHPDITIYATYAHETDANVNWLSIGYTPHSKTQGYLQKDISVFFAGQMNHDYRKRMMKYVGGYPDGEFELSKGFAQGLDRDTYIEKTRRAKVIPAPRGNISPDSFRLYESLEHAALPVAEDRKFFETVFENPPFPIIDTAENWYGCVNDGVLQFPKPQNNASAWWQRYKCELFNRFNQPDDVTVVIPVSPIKSHPDTTVLDETIRSIRQHIDCQIIITFDGVREEQEDRREDYELFINNILASGYDRIYPIIFDEHTHQSGMMRKCLEVIETPLVLYVEQDTPLTADRDIDWHACKQLLLNGDSDLVRFHFESHIPDPHKHLMLGKPRNGFLKTIQWSQRPHLATTAYYRRVMQDYFSSETKSFIEDKMHSVVWVAYDQDGPLGWQQHRLHIYHPDGDIKRSYHTDGRAGEEKYDDTQIF
jgi:hypothetical protein